MSARILVLEDEDGIRRALRINLEAEGFQVRDYASAEQVLEDGAGLDSVALGIFDIMLPGEMDGLELCRRLREKKHGFPVIFLTARNRLDDKLRGFESGGDDYMTKPFELEELLARVHARLRRSDSGSGGEITIGAHVLDLEKGLARAAEGGEPTRFNARETAILRLLVEHRGGPVSRDLILDTVWGTAEFPTNRTVDNYIVKFRKIFEEDPREPRWFITRHGQGYELASEE